MASTKRDKKNGAKKNSKYCLSTGRPIILAIAEACSDREHVHMRQKGGSTVVVDRGMAYDENLEEIRAYGHHYLVASRQPERNSWLAEFENEDDWEEVMRTPSPRNPGQKKSQVQIKRRQKENEVYILCVSEGREAKDRAIREKHELQLKEDLQALKTRIEKGQLKTIPKIHEAVGRLKERYPRVARYYRMEYDVLFVP
jgi:hypothetical protein